MTDLDPRELFEAVVADPDNLDIRLKYADAIAAADPARAEYVRLQIARHRSTRRAGPPLTQPEADRLAELDLAIRKTVLEPFAGAVSTAEARRGFVEMLRLPGEAFLRDGAHLFRQGPIRHLFLDKVDADTVDRLRASPLLGRLVTLGLNGDRERILGDEGVRHLLRSPHLGKIRWLSLTNAGIGAAGAEHFAANASRVLPNLEYLAFRHNAVDLTPLTTHGGDYYDADPPAIVVPELGRRLDRTYGPFPWMNPQFAIDRPDYWLN